MAMEMSVTRTQPQRTVTDWPSVKVMYKVVLRPKGTAMMANELQNKEQHQHAVVYTVQRSSQQKIKTDNRKKKKKKSREGNVQPEDTHHAEMPGQLALIPHLGQRLVGAGIDRRLAHLCGIGIEVEPKRKETW